MSEQEIVKNYPGTSEAHNHDGQGAFASGGDVFSTGTIGIITRCCLFYCQDKG